ncbi:hypothetical protein B0H14DRAFT_3163165 [Mycena olivaceomarginata]|nr:hypothetical protein B0H14DRAFT_3163165 [Mycena olivaceomarginata]
MKSRSSDSALPRCILDYVLVPTLGSLRREVIHWTKSETPSAPGTASFSDNDRDRINFSPNLNTQSCGETKLSRQKKWLIYPDAIDQSNLSGRVRSMAQYLDLMIHDAEVLELSPVWTSFLDDVGHKNVQFRELGSKADFNSATRGQCCGYYGPNGASAIEAEILAMLVAEEEQLSRAVRHTVQKTFDANTWNHFDGYDAVFGLTQFVAIVLTPFVATMLIQEDTGMKYSINEANVIRRATSTVGDEMQPIDTENSEYLVMSATEANASWRARSALEDEIQPTGDQLSERPPFTPNNLPGSGPQTIEPESEFTAMQPPSAQKNYSTEQMEKLRDQTRLPSGATLNPIPLKVVKHDSRAHRNRIAAQNSRDRRKAQFSYLERRVSELEEENRQLRAGLLVAPNEPECEQTTAQKNNKELRERLMALEKGWEAVVTAAQALDTNGG